MKLLGNQQKPLVGIDIGANAVKVLQLSRSGRQWTVQRYAVEPSPRNTLVENVITDVDQLSQTIERAVKKSGTRLKRAAVAISTAHVITKTITMPSGLTDAELEEQIELEADHYIPYPLDEVNLDFEVLGPSESSRHENEVLLAACRKEIVEDYVASVEQAGLQPAVVDVDAFAVENAFSLVAKQLPSGGKKQAVAVLDFGSATTLVSVLHNRQTIYTRAHNFGGQRLNKEIQNKYGLSPEEARLAIRSGDLPRDYITEVLNPFIDSMAQETLRALQFFYSSSPYNSIDKLMLVGGCAQLPGVVETLSQRIGVPTTLANPFSGMNVSGSIKGRAFKQDSSGLFVACGLAMRA